MISSTRSSESASRSSWKFASSVISLSSTPSWSDRTSFTRSRTSSRDAAISPHLRWGPLRARRCFTVGKTLAQALDHPVLDPAGGQPVRVRDRAVRCEPFGDHREPPQPEEVGPAVRVRVEARAQAAGGGTDQDAPELAPSRRADLLAERVQQLADRPFEQLQRAVAGEAVGDDDVGGAAEQIAGFGVAEEVQVAPAQELVRFEGELVPLLRLLADREQPDFRP